MRTPVIENRLKDYIINIFNQHLNLRIEFAGFLDWKPQQEYERTNNSYSFKIGRFITWFRRKIKLIAQYTWGGGNSQSGANQKKDNT